MKVVKYCVDCKHRDKTTSEYPCNECYCEPNSRMWEDKKNKGGIKMNLVFILHGGDKKYLYLVPENVELKLGEKVYVTTRYGGETMGDCATNSFKIDIEAFAPILLGLGVETAIQNVIGYAQKKYIKIDF